MKQFLALGLMMIAAMSAGGCYYSGDYSSYGSGHHYRPSYSHHSHYSHHSRHDYHRGPAYCPPPRHHGGHHRHH